MKKSKYFPSLEDFIDNSRKGNIIPVYTEILADTETPVSAFKKIDQGGDSFLFESVEGGEKWGRYSFLGTDPRATILSKGSAVAITVGEEVTTLEGDPIEIIRAAISSYKPVEVEGAPKFSGGAIGYIGYDAIRHIEKLPELTKDDLNVPDIFLVITDTMLVFDNMEHKITVIANVFVEGEVDLKEAYAEGVAKIEAIVSRLREGKTSRSVSSSECKAGPVASTFKKEEFLDAVRRTKEYIRSGDIIQAVISQRFSVELTGDPDPFDIYRTLRIINPSPYMFFLRLAGITLAGSSPEILVGNDGPDIRVRPIAGTRPRGADVAEDQALEIELLADPKERAEHIMLVDLGRTDVGRVAETGSVE
ncbi:MAG: chorismate-binding protein, partial [Proteobacteria bacterium]|nr:chorismate-binding protein [Pseudomonadota bacterium]